MPSLEDARKNRDKHHRHSHGGLTPPPHHGAGPSHPPAHSSTPKNTKNLATPPQSKRADSKTDKPMVTPAAAPRVEPLPVRAGSVAYRPSPRKDGGSSGPDLGHPFKASSIRRGDSLWRIAKRELGKGHRWREIRTAHGGHLTERAAKRLQIGTPVYLPSNSSSQNNLSIPMRATSTPSYSTTSYTRKPSSNLTTKPVPFMPASSGTLKSQSTSSAATALAPTSQKKSGVKSAPLASKTLDSPKKRHESGIQRSTSTKKNDFDKRSTALSSTSRRNPGGQPNAWLSTTAGSSRTKRESGQKNSQPPASWAGFPIIAQVAQSRVAQAHHVATRIGAPMAEAQSSAALAGGVRGAVLLKSPSAVNPMVEAFGSSQVRGAAKGAFKVFAPIGIAVDAVQLRSAWKKDNGFGPNVRQVAGSAAGGWVGAAGGVELGAAIGSLVPGVGTVIGALMGGMAGAVAGSGVGRKVAEQAEQSFQGEQPQQKTSNFSRAYPHW
jgi:nucleoid-associated protein YgaU